MIINVFKKIIKFVESSNENYSILKTYSFRVFEIKKLIKNNIITKTEHNFYGKSFSEKDLISIEKIEKSENVIYAKFSDDDFENDYKRYFNNTKIIRLKDDFGWYETSINFMYFGFRKPSKISIKFIENEYDTTIVFEQNEMNLQFIFTLIYGFLFYGFWVLLLMSQGILLVTIFEMDVTEFFKYELRIFILYVLYFFLILVFAIFQTGFKNILYNKKMNIFIDRFNLIIFNGMLNKIEILKYSNVNKV